LQREELPRRIGRGRNGRSRWRRDRGCCHPAILTAVGPRHSPDYRGRRQS
jgi:hypothetical protein